MSFNILCLLNYYCSLIHQSNFSINFVTLSLLTSMWKKVLSQLLRIRYKDYCCILLVLKSEIAEIMPHLIHNFFRIGEIRIFHAQETDLLLSRRKAERAINFCRCDATRTCRNSLIPGEFHFIDISFPFSEILLAGTFVLRDFSFLSLWENERCPFEKAVRLKATSFPLACKSNGDRSSAVLSDAGY